MASSSSGLYYGGNKLARIFEEYSRKEGRIITSVHDLKNYIKRDFGNAIANKLGELEIHENVPDNVTRLDYEIDKLDNKEDILFFSIQTEVEYDYKTPRTFITSYGYTNYGNLMRVQFDNIEHKFYFKFPEWLFHNGYKAAYERWTFNDTIFLKDTLNNALKAMLSPKEYSKYQRYAKSYGHNEDSLLHNLDIEWNIDSVGYRLDLARPFFRAEVVHPKVISALIAILINPLGKTKKKKDDEEDENENDWKYQNRVSWIDEITKRVNVDTINTKILKNQWHTYESHGNTVMQFLEKYKLKSSEWWRISDYETHEKRPHQINVDINVICNNNYNIKSLESSHHLYDKYPDFPIMVFDDEMAGSKGRFPKAKNGDPIIGIGVHIFHYSGFLKKMTINEMDNNKKHLAVYFSKGKIDDFKSVSVTKDNEYHVHAICTKGDHAELNLLRKKECFFLMTNPMGVHHHNGNSFDWLYEMTRSFMLTYDDKTGNVPNYDRFKNIDYFLFTRDLRPGKGFYHKKARKTTTKFARKASARVSCDSVEITGVFNCDNLLYARQYGKQGQKGNFSLDALSFSKLGETKIEINYDFISSLMQTKEGRTNLAVYCNRDVELTARLTSIMGMYEYMFCLGKLSSVPCQKLVDRGTQYLVTGIWYSQPTVTDPILLYDERLRPYFSRMWKDHADKYFPHQSVTPRLLMPGSAFYVKEVEGPLTIPKNMKAGGAMVISPIPGMYKHPVTVEDMQSLYPSIMICRNEDPTALIPHNLHDTIIPELERICEEIGVDKNDATFKRPYHCYARDTENKNSLAPKKHATLKDAMAYINSPACEYTDEIKEILLAKYEKLISENSEAEINKWLPFAENDENFDNSANKMEWSTQSESDEAIMNAFVNIVEPVCQIIGRTKITYLRKDMPIFVGHSIRRGVYAKLEIDLFNLRRAYKAKVANAEEEIDRMVREGVPENHIEIVTLKNFIKFCDTVQNSLKLVMNSIYGFFQACYQLGYTLSESICQEGQVQTQIASNFNDTMVKRALGFIGDGRTIYGDTDSVFTEIYGADHFPLFEELSRFIVDVVSKRNNAEFNLEALNQKKKEIDDHIKVLVDDNKLKRKFASKVGSYLLLYHLLSNYNEYNLFLGDFDRDRYAPFFKLILDWQVNSFKSAGINHLDLDNSTFNNVGCLPTPPLFESHNITSCLNGMIRWYNFQLYFASFSRATRLKNTLYNKRVKGNRFVLELEKGFDGFYLAAKKKYGGNRLMPDKNKFEIKSSGLASVRGDSYPFRSFICDKLVETIVNTLDRNKIFECAFSLIDRIMKGDVDIFDLIQSKSVKKAFDQYGEPQPKQKEFDIVVTDGMPVHIVFSIMKHNLYGEELPQIGDRIKFLVAQNNMCKKTNTSERAIAPDDVIIKGKPIRYDKEYAMDNCINLMTSMLAVIYDTSPFWKRYEKADTLRRADTNDYRSKLASEFTKQLRDPLKKQLKIYAKNGCRQIDKSNILKEFDFVASKDVKIDQYNKPTTTIEYEDVEDDFDILNTQYYSSSSSSSSSSIDYDKVKSDIEESKQKRKEEHDKKLEEERQRVEQREKEKQAKLEEWDRLSAEEKQKRLFEDKMSRLKKHVYNKEFRLILIDDYPNCSKCNKDKAVTYRRNCDRYVNKRNYMICQQCKIEEFGFCNGCQCSCCISYDHDDEYKQCTGCLTYTSIFNHEICVNCETIIQKMNEFKIKDQHVITSYYISRDNDCLLCGKNKVHEIPVCHSCRSSKSIQHVLKEISEIEYAVRNKQLNVVNTCITKCSHGNKYNNVDIEDIANTIDNFYKNNALIKECTSISCRNRANRTMVEKELLYIRYARIRINEIYHNPDIINDDKDFHFDHDDEPKAPIDEDLGVNFDDDETIQSNRNKLSYIAKQRPTDPKPKPKKPTKSLSDCAKRIQTFFPKPQEPEKEEPADEEKPEEQKPPKPPRPNKLALMAKRAPPKEDDKKKTNKRRRK